MTLSYNRPFRMIERRKTRQIMVGDVAVGGDAPISVQTMTNTLTSDAQATIEQISSVAEAGTPGVKSHVLIKIAQMLSEKFVIQAKYQLLLIFIFIIKGQLRQQMQEQHA